MQLGRSALEAGSGSSELLLLMATAGQLGDGSSCSLDDVRGWLDQATSLSPDSPETWLELGHFLDAVADEPQLAASAFETALEKSLAFLVATLDGLGSTAPSQDDAMKQRLTEVRQYVVSLLNS